MPTNNVNMSETLHSKHITNNMFLCGLNGLTGAMHLARKHCKFCVEPAAGMFGCRFTNCTKNERHQQTRNLNRNEL